jgi:predicted enzyme related to lactoylglutathione lyase
MSALVVFSVDVRRLATFYETVLGVAPNVESSGDIRLFGDREEILIHSLPRSVTKTILIETPPEPREGSPLKPVFDVDSLEAALQKVEEKGGVLTGRTFSIGGIARHDVLDPDGNVIQLRGRNS